MEETADHQDDGEDSVVEGAIRDHHCSSRSRGRSRGRRLPDHHHILWVQRGSVNNWGEPERPPHDREDWRGDVQYI